jgi:hypothetical protein
MEKRARYFVISVSPDGISIGEATKEEIEADLQQEAKESAGGLRDAYLKVIPCGDIEEWAGELHRMGAPLESERLKLIIKGEIVVPKPRQVVTQYEIE